MKTSIGSIGLQKCALLKLASLQMMAKGERFHPRMLAKAVKSKKALIKIESEVVAGEETLLGAAYGESLFASEEIFKDVLKKMGLPEEVVVNE